MTNVDTEKCGAMVLQAMEAVEEKDEEAFAWLLYPVPAGDWKAETGETAFPTAGQFWQALAEIESYGFSIPYHIENVCLTEEYYGRNWYEARQIPVTCAAEVSVCWAATEKRTVCRAWPVSFQCLYIEKTWYLNPYWVWENKKN